MTSTFMVKWRRRHRRELGMRFHVAAIRNRIAWGCEVDIVDLSDPDGKRLLFDPPAQMTDYTFTLPQPLPGS